MANKRLSNKLSYGDFIKKIENNQIEPVYIFTGNQIHLMEGAVKRLKDKLLGQSDGFDFFYFYGDSTSANEILNCAKTYPMFSKKRLIVVRHAEKLPQQEIRILDAYFPNPSAFTCLILLFTEDKNLAFKNREKLYFVSFDLNTKDMLQEIREEAKKLGYSITKEAIETLISLVGHDIQYIHKELEKISLFMDKKQIIEKGDIQQIIEKTTFEDAFHLTNALAERNKKKALNILIELQKKGEEPLIILNRIYWRFRLIWKVKELMEKNTTEEAMLRELGVSSGSLYYLKQHAKNFSYRDIKHIIETTYKSERWLKTSSVPRDTPLVNLILEFFNSKGKS